MNYINIKNLETKEEKKGKRKFVSSTPATDTERQKRRKLGKIIK